MDAIAIITIARTNGNETDAVRQQTYQVPLKEQMTLLQVLNYIYENLDSTIGFARYCCGIQYCNSCRMTINGRGVHACHFVIDEGEYLLEPYKGYKVIKDLFVDWDKRLEQSNGS